MHFSIEMCTYLQVNTTLYPKDTFIPISFDDSFKHVNSNALLLSSIFFSLPIFTLVQFLISNVFLHHYIIYIIESAVEFSKYKE